MKEIDIIQGSEIWHDYRNNHIMGTDSSVIAGDLKHWGRTPLKLWQEKIGEESQVIVTERMERGKALEPLAREHFTMLTAIDVYPAVIESEELPWAAASLDGISYDKKIIVEIKVHNEETYAKTLSGYIPESYRAQFQKQMFVGALDWLYYFPFDGSHGHVVKIYRDDAYIKEMIEREKIFWDCICNLVPPEECEQDFEYVDDPYLIKLSWDYKQIKKVIEAYEKEEKLIRDALIEGMNGKNSICGSLKIKQVFRKGSISYGDIPELQGIDLEQYRKKPIEYSMIKEISS